MKLLLSLMLLQDPPLPGMEWSGIDGFIVLLVREGISFQEGWEDANPETTLVIVFGEAPPVPLDLYRFVQRGGRLVVASDRASIDTVLSPFGLRLQTGPIRVRGADATFHGYRDCPLVHPVVQPHQVFAMRLFNEVGHVAFNKPGYFDADQVRRTRWDILARFPTLVGGGNPPCIVGSDEPRAVFISDHSPFINLMLPEMENLLFAKNLLKEMGRRRVLFFYNGKILGSKDLPANLPAIPPGTLRALNPALRHLEMTGALNRFIRGHWGEILASLTLLGLAGFGIWMYRRESQPPETGPSALLQRFSDEKPDHRRRNYALAAKELLDRVRESAPQWPDGKWQAWVARRKYNRLRRDRDTLPAVVSARQFSRWLRMAQDLSDAGIVKWTLKA